jgi:putative membrane protein
MPRAAADASADRPASPATRGERLRRVAALGVGAVLLGLLVHWSGVGPIVVRLRMLGWAAPLVLLPYVVINAFDTLAWRCTLPSGSRVPFGSLYLSRMAGEAVNSLTPTAAVGGEPVKAHLLRAFGVSGPDGVASIVIAKTALTVSQIAFLLIGIGVLFDRLDRRAVGIASLLILVAASGGFTAMLVRLQRRGPAAAVWGWLRRLAPRARLVAHLESRAHAIDTRLAEFYRIEGHAFRNATLLNFVSWLLGVVEVVVMMDLIDAPIPWRDALIVEALAQPIRATALVIPGGLGAQELGGVAFCTAVLGIAEPDAAALWLMKRGRELAFDAVGLVYLTRRAAR